MESYRFSFEKLEVWQMARNLTINVYKVTARYPAEEKYSLVSQMRRAALSVCANLAEGSSRYTAKDQAHFTTIAFSSLLELLNHQIISVDLGFLPENELLSFRKDIQSLSVRLVNLKTSQLKRIST
jgi:four helix bundle protein